jgi:hypothetical protein
LSESSAKLKTNLVGNSTVLYPKVVATATHSKKAGEIIFLQEKTEGGHWLNNCINPFGPT